MLRIFISGFLLTLIVLLAACGGDDGASESDCRDLCALGVECLDELASETMNQDDCIASCLTNNFPSECLACKSQDVCEAFFDCVDEQCPDITEEASDDSYDDEYGMDR